MTICVLCSYDSQACPCLLFFRSQCGCVLLFQAYFACLQSSCPRQLVESVMLNWPVLTTSACHKTTLAFAARNLVSVCFISDLNLGEFPSHQSSAQIAAHLIGNMLTLPCWKVWFCIPCIHLALPQPQKGLSLEGEHEQVWDS